MSQTRPVTGAAFAALGVSAIAMGAILAASSDLGPVATAFWRMALGAPLCLGATLFVGGAGEIGRVLRLLRSPCIWLAACCFAATLTLWYSGQRLSSVATTSALQSLSPLMLILGLLVLWRQPVSLATCLGTALAALGAVVLALHSGGAGPRALEGDALASLSAATLAFYYGAVTRASRDMSAWSVLTAICVIAAPILLAAALLTEPGIAPATPESWAQLGLLALLGQGIGQTCLAQASRCLGAVGVSTATLAEPALAALFAAGILGAPLLASQALGIALIMAGLWFGQRRSVALAQAG